MYRSVIVGCGSISKKHADAIIKSGNILVAACDADSTALDSFCQKYNCRAYKDYREMLENENPDALHICLPHYLHVDVATLALSKGIAVLLEKPPAISEISFAELEKYGDEKLTVCFQNRFNLSTLSAKEIIDSGIYGRLLGANAAVTWNRYGDYYQKSDWRGKKNKEGGSVLINQAIHTLDLLCVLLGSPTSVKVLSSNLDHPDTDTEDTLCALIDFDDKRATFFATTCAASSPPATITLLFEKGRVMLDSKSLTVLSGAVSKTDYESKTDGKECWGDSHEKIIKEFYNFLDGGENPCSVSD